jgi:phosphoglycolate phosphatase
VVAVSRTGVIFDLDDTLVDTHAVRNLRARRAWREAVAALSHTTVFPGVREVLDALHVRGIPWAVVTTSVSYYATAVLSHHALGSPPLTAYHDASPKPNPGCVLHALKRIQVAPGDAIAVGDHLNDHRAYEAAGVLSLGAGWSPQLQPAEWAAVLTDPAQLLRYV